MPIRSINPTTERINNRYEEISEENIKEIIKNCHKESNEWKKISLEDRAILMGKVAFLLREEKERYSRLMAQEMGKPVSQGRGEIEKCAWVCEHYAEQASSYLQPESLPSDASRSYVAFRPLGVVLAVMPWNFPFWQVFRFAAPALMAGNGALLKHSSNVPGCALAIEDLFRRAGFPDHIFRTLMIGSGSVDQVIANPLVRAVTLTGSEQAGRKVAAKAGEMLKKTVLELGGSDPFVVLPGADLGEAATVGAHSRCINAGQSCIAAKRFIVVGDIYDAFVEHLRRAMASLKTGNPLDEETEVGPMARGDLREELHAQVQASVLQGADLILGGVLPEGPGFFYPPTLLTGVQPGMPAFDEELFGPVAAMIRARDVEDALQLANQTSFGLGGSVWDKDSLRAEHLAARIEAGAVFVNGMVKSDPRLPFGGIKDSGYGRELSAYGIREFVNIQTVWVR
ncbi:MAG: NAD-dependent succinate-semialdehyde dehydrogenase [Syntrophotaleaceae bacterium]